MIYIYKLFWILETTGFTKRPLAHETLLCLAAEYTFSCACVAMKQKENKSWVCIGKSWVCMSPSILKGLCIRNRFVFSFKYTAIEFLKIIREKTKK